MSRTALAANPLLWAWLVLIPSLACAAPSVQVSTVPAAERVLRETLAAYGRVRPDPDHVRGIALPHAGVINRLWVRLGQRVAAGDALLEVDTAPAARMDYQQAQAAVDFARKDLQRLERLFEEQLATRDQVNTARHALVDAESKLQAQRALGTGEKRETLRAPFAGIVSQLSVHPGQRVPPDTVALLVASGDALVVPLGVEPEDAHRVRPGMAVTLTSVFQLERTIETRVADVHAMINPATRLVDVLVRVPPTVADPPMLDSYVRGLIILREQRTLAVPRSAVLTDAHGPYVFVVRGGKAHRVDVQTGLRQDGEIGVQGALGAGEPVVSAGNYELEDGMAVRDGTP
jgi:membrane fusion protein, multidrug efflux system